MPRRKVCVSQMAKGNGEMHRAFSKLARHIAIVIDSVKTHMLKSH
jgi:hypothetical protein